MPPVSDKVGNRQRQFDALVRAHAGDLYRFAYWLSGEDARAQDLVQETLLRAWRAIGSLRDGAAIKPWLLTILRREHARGFERKAFDLTELDDAIPDESGSGPEGAGSDEQVRAAILQLEPKYREPLLMQVLGGFSCEEIASELGSKPGAVMTQLFRARQKLRALLEPAPGAVDGGKHRGMP
ncbi:MAG: sigma-70 family RNA polymerase sigma factor [Proteobacteria bacterium]|nr:sigma-70 family RNA polymerase sigma factor [Pseudomonadota bacterium]